MAQAAMLFDDHGVAWISSDEISFGSTIRLVIIGNVQYLCVRDIIMSVCDVTSKGARQKWDRLSGDQKNELDGTLETFRFFGRGQVAQPMITFRGALKLVMFVSGSMASLFHAMMVNILQKHYTGEDSLLEEVDANALAERDASAVNKKRSREDVTHEMDMAERRMALDERRMKMQIENQKMQMEAFQTHKLIMDSYSELCSDDVMDDRAKRLFKDNLLNSVSSFAPSAPSAPSASVSSGSDEI